MCCVCPSLWNEYSIKKNFHFYSNESCTAEHLRGAKNLGNLVVLCCYLVEENYLSAECTRRKVVSSPARAVKIARSLKSLVQRCQEIEENSSRN